MNSSAEHDSTDFQTLYSGVLQSFTVILCGYITGALKLVTHEGLQGLNTFVGTFCLPALIFTSLAELNLGSVNWLFLLAIFISKTIMFFVVLFVSLLVNKTNRLGKAGLFAMFCTQSNDFAIGYPIVASLYAKTHPDFANYLYLIAPINLVMLNPFGFVCLEIEKERNERAYGTALCKWKLAFQMTKGILLNPIVLMTILGIIGNFIFNHTLPVLLDGVLKVLGSAFSATALFVLGLHMAGSQRDSRGSGIITIGVLVVLKTFLLPVITQQVVYLLNAGGSWNETVVLSNYGFLYGTFPTAPSVFVYATQYNLGVDMIARGLVGATFLSAPVMMISAKMVSFSHLNPADYINDLDSFIFDVGIFGLIGSLWVILVYILSKKWKAVPHCITLHLFIAQSLTCIGAVIWFFAKSTEVWSLNIQYAILAFGCFTTRIWSALSALAILFLKIRGLCFTLRLRFFFCLVGWGVPAALVSFLTFTMQEEVLMKKQHPLFQFGQTQAIISLTLLIITFLVTSISLILQVRLTRRNESITNDGNTSDDEQEESSSLFPSKQYTDDDNPEITVTDIEDLIPDDTHEHNAVGESSSSINPTCPGEYSCDPHHRKTCNRIVRSYEEDLLSNANRTDDIWDEGQQFRHTILFLLLAFSMLLGIALCIWTLVLEEVTGVYVELVFLDAALNYGQGFFAFFLFGINKKILSIIRSIVGAIKGMRERSEHSHQQELKDIQTPQQNTQ